MTHRSSSGRPVALFVVATVVALFLPLSVSSMMDIWSIDCSHGPPPFIDELYGNYDTWDLYMDVCGPGGDYWWSDGGGGRGQSGGGGGSSNNNDDRDCGSVPNCATRCCKRAADRGRCDSCSELCAACAERSVDCDSGACPGMAGHCCSQSPSAGAKCAMCPAPCDGCADCTIHSCPKDPGLSFRCCPVGKTKCAGCAVSCQCPSDDCETCPAPPVPPAVPHARLPTCCPRGKTRCATCEPTICENCNTDSADCVAHVQCPGPLAISESNCCPEGKPRCKTCPRTCCPSRGCTLDASCLPSVRYCCAGDANTCLHCDLPCPVCQGTRDDDCIPCPNAVERRCCRPGGTRCHTCPSCDTVCNVESLDCRKNHYCTWPDTTTQLCCDGSRCAACGNVRCASQHSDCPSADCQWKPGCTSKQMCCNGNKCRLCPTNCIQCLSLDESPNAAPTPLTACTGLRQGALGLSRACETKLQLSKLLPRAVADSCLDHPESLTCRCPAYGAQNDYFDRCSSESCGGAAEACLCCRNTLDSRVNATAVVLQQCVQEQAAVAARMCQSFGHAGLPGVFHADANCSVGRVRTAGAWKKPKVPWLLSSVSRFDAEGDLLDVRACVRCMALGRGGFTLPASNFGVKETTATLFAGFVQGCLRRSQDLASRVDYERCLAANGCPSGL